MTEQQIAQLICAIGGPLLILGGLIALAFRRRFLAGTARATGVVSRVETFRDNRTLFSNQAHILFHTPDGTGHTIIDTYSGRRFYRAQQKLTIAYDPLDPARAMPVNFKSVWALPVILGAWGLLLSGVAIYTLLR
ncbi:MAG TPA: DUF3592 domain-containing protein [Thermoflexales bacterium]|jgi:hypothetical protein|nr:DUF3592 domain-containing protein [Anaerolineae bacterium]HQV28999.1 DUF3592 domain-containing protein [Thermoflexales bacterium]HQX11276.1 DUF3592 domain-containing protein [Thermoflexales bacterium]HQY25251.1 DUF3592 domain-containing protein [Thermoflexales bacterium]HQZ54108.1 DUF3592 domain-containing protein [Thermoflexales bacterium]